MTRMNTRHGMSETPTYYVWVSMIQRCTNPRCVAYPDYGGRGIRVCEPWMDFANFLADVGEKPERLSLDRIDNSRGYEPGNVRWATSVEQNNNTRWNRRVEHQGRVMTIAQWAKETGAPYHRIYEGLKRGRSMDEILDAKS